MQDLPDAEFSFKNFFTPLTSVKAITIIAIIGIIVFGNMLFNGFVWDDIAYIINNNDVHSLNLLLSFQQNEFNLGFYRPLDELYYAIQYSIFQQNAFPYHFFQLLLHIINASLLYLFFRKFFKANISFCLALIFLVHPIQVESVVYISASYLNFLFIPGLSSLMIIMDKKLTPIVSVILFSLFLIMLLLQESGIMFLILPLIYAILFKPKKVKRLIIIELLTFGAYLLIRSTFIGSKLTTSSNGITIASLDLTHRIISMPQIALFYMKTFLFPSGIAVDQLWTVSSVTFQDFYLPILILLLILAAFIFFGFILKRQLGYATEFKVYTLFLTWFLVGMAIHLQIIPLDLTVSDRWFYVTMVGLLGVLGIVYGYFEKRMNTKIVLLVFIVLISALSIRTIVRNTNWYSSLTLFQHDEKITQNYSIEDNLGVELSGASEYKEAIAHEKLSVALSPNESNTSNLAMDYEAVGNYKDAKRYFKEAFKTDSSTTYIYKVNNQNVTHRHSELLYINYALFLTLHDTPRATISFLHNALKEYPDTPELWVFLAASKDNLKQYDEATTAIDRAIQLSPSQNTTYVQHQIEHHLPVRFDVAAPNVSY